MTPCITPSAATRVPSFMRRMQSMIMIMTMQSMIMTTPTPCGHLSGADWHEGDGSHLAQAGYSHLAHLLDDAIMRGVERAAQ